MRFETAESFSDRIPALWPLLSLHRDELATDPDLMELAPHIERYKGIEAAGALFAIYAFEGSLCIGYSVNFVGPNMHYSGLKVSQNDIVYLAKDYRGGAVGVKLLQATEAEAKARGCQMHIWHAKPGTALDKLLPRLGYRVQDVLHSKVL